MKFLATDSAPVTIYIQTDDVFVLITSYFQVNSQPSLPYEYLTYTYALLISVRLRAETL
jgi:hypothetical protein